ncbi:helix-turn-helix domain-containing protein, partial [Pseudonocardia asaccharolytica]
MRFRRYPTPEQEAGLLGHCGHARFVWNLAVEQLGYRVRGQRVPGYVEQARQLTEARAAVGWLGEGSQTVQQQALRDFAQAVRNWQNDTHGRPTWRRKGRREGFRIVGPAAGRVEQLGRRWARVWVPKVGWVKLRRTLARARRGSRRRARLK